MPQCRQIHRIEEGHVESAVEFSNIWRIVCLWPPTFTVSEALGRHGRQNAASSDPSSSRILEVDVELLTEKQLRQLLQMRSMATSGTKSVLISRLLGEEPPPAEVVIDTDNIDAFVASIENIKAVTISELRRVIGLLETDSFGDARKIAIAALTYHLWQALRATRLEDRDLLFERLEEPQISPVDDAHQLVESIPSIAGYPELGADLLYLQREEERLCELSDAERKPPIPIQKYAQLLQPLAESDNPAISEMLPLLIAQKSSSAVDATLSCGATAEERQLANELEVKLGEWVASRPWIDNFLDPPYMMLIRVDGQAPGFQAILNSVDARRMISPPVDPADGAPVPGMVQLAGNVESARSMGNITRTHFRNAAGNLGGPAPQDPGNNYRIISFATTANGIIHFH